MTELLTFQQAIGRTTENKRSLLMGNGFSIACRSSLFSYEALFDESERHLSQLTINMFASLETTDFERVINAFNDVKSFAKVSDAVDTGTTDCIDNEISTLRDQFAKAVARNHPNRISDIKIKEFMACRKFLSHFARYYTVNYDLLLYWALMQTNIDDLKIKSDDGFRTPRSGPEDYVQWYYSGVEGQNVYYLHGALHLFDASDSIQKYTWSNTGIALVDQIREALEMHRFPIYVAEGDTASKVQRVLHNAYLIRGFRSLSSIGGALFVFGHSLSSTDEHVFDCVINNQVTDLFVSIYGDPWSEDNQRIMHRAQELTEHRQQSRRKNPPELQVHFYDAESANVWGDPSLTA